MRPTIPKLINVLVPVKRSIDYAVYAFFVEQEHAIWRCMGSMSKTGIWR